MGDQVTAYDPSTGKSSTQTVQHVWINHDHDLLDVTLREDGQDGHATAASSSDKTQQVATKAHGSQAPPAGNADETIHTTAKHPWLTTDRGWVQAGDLHTGEHIVELDGRTATITALAVRPGAATYYNLTVSQLHTYAVGGGQFVVHNTEGCLDYPQLADARAKEIFNGVSIGWWSRKELTVGVGYFPDSEGNLIRHVTINESAVEKYGQAVQDFIRGSGDQWLGPIQTAAGDAHAEDTFIHFEARGSSQPVGVGASKYICPECFSKMTTGAGWPTSVIGTASPLSGFYPLE